MTPVARASAAIEILDRILAGAPAEAVLTTWARGNRYAGSGDRAAIRDLVFDVLRCRASCAALGGAVTGRGLLIGHYRAQGTDLSTIFNSDRFAPGPLDPLEAASGSDPDGYDRLDVPHWIGPQLETSLGPQFAEIMAAQQRRAPVFLRVNARKATPAEAIRVLSGDGISARPCPLAKTALEVTDNARKIQNSNAYLTGAVELQDASSQAAIEALPLRPGMRVLDYCTGGGGKVLAMAGLVEGAFFAHDIDAGRMRDLPLRAARAGVEVTVFPPGEVRGEFDLVLVDAPCSGSGTWRRTPDAKWRLTAEFLTNLIETQAGILQAAARHVAPGGVLAYMTCSLLDEENIQQVERFAARSGWNVMDRVTLTPLSGGDGFFAAWLQRASHQD